MNQAAGTLVYEGNKILAFQRSGEESYSLPCGKVDPGETSAEAAIRETFEETGLLVELMGQPFVGVELNVECLVSTYRAKVVGGKMYEKAEEEGKPVWIDVHQLIEGPFWNYNERLLRHFGFNLPTRRVWVIGATGVGKTTFSKNLAAQLQMPVVEAGLLARQICHPDADIQVITETGRLKLAEDSRFFSDNLKSRLGNFDAVVSGVRNPVDFLNSFNPHADFVIFLPGEAKTKFEDSGIQAIWSILGFFEQNGIVNSSLAEQVVTLVPDKTSEVWYDATRFKSWFTCRGEWQLLGV